MRQLREEIARVAPSHATVMIEGESGTGKELVARRLHHLSDRARRQFVRVNSAAIPEELIESELFGHEKGSFTGAHRRQVGKFVQADGGTIFLDEVGDMSLKTQAKVLRVLQDGEVEPVGAGSRFQVDVRVIAATNKDSRRGGPVREFSRGPLLPAWRWWSCARRRCATTRRTFRRWSSISPISSAASTTAAPRAGATPPSIS